MNCPAQHAARTISMRDSDKDFYLFSRSTDTMACSIKPALTVKNLPCSRLFFITALILTCLTAAARLQAAPLNASIHPVNPVQGEAALVTVRPCLPVVSLTGIVDDQKLIFYPNGDNSTFNAILGVDLDTLPGMKTITLTAATKAHTPVTESITFTVCKKEFQIQRLTLPKGQVSLSKKSLARHYGEKKRVTSVICGTINEKLWDGGFALPCSAPVSTPFGVRRIMNNEPRNPHSGVDLKADAGTPVLSSNAGRVVLTGDFFFSGNSVFVDHGAGVVTMYFHLSSIDVTEGQRVHKGQCLGRVGSTGRSTGAHLHWGARINNQRIDPFSLIALFNTGE